MRNVTQGLGDSRRGECNRDVTEIQTLATWLKCERLVEIEPVYTWNVAGSECIVKTGVRWVQAWSEENPVV